MPCLLPEIGNLSTHFKPTIRTPEPEWKQTTIAEIPTLAAGIPADSLKHGHAGIWFQPVFRDDKAKRYWLCLDVEDLTEHDDTAANIKAAQGLYTWLDERGLTERITVSLSGRGFRFSWPYIVQPEYNKAFLEWIAHPDFKSCIDPALQTTTNIGVRLFAYRGNKAQGKPIDVHTHVLPASSDLMTLTVAEYQRMTAGKVSAGTFLEWLSGDLLPSSFAPAPWIDLFEHFDQLRKLKGSIIDVNFPKRKAEGTLNRAAIFDHLDDLGISYTEKQWSDRIIWHLDRCPICGRRDGNAIVTEAGRLKCWHANTCEAGQVDEKGYRKGLLPHEWIDGYEGIEDDRIDEPTDFKSINQVREEIREAVNGTGDFLITATPGTGKTGTVLREIIPRCHDEKIIYIAPTKELDGEVFKEALKLAEESEIAITWLKGRSTENCTRFNRTVSVASKGYSPGAIVCPSCDTRKAGECIYRNQFKAMEQPGLFISTHSQSKFLKLESEAFDLMIVDENPINPFITKKEIGFDPVLKLKTSVIPEVASFFGKIQSIMEQKHEILVENGKKGAHDRLYASNIPTGSQWENCSDLWEQAGITEKEKEAVRRYLASYQPFEGETVSKWQRRLYYDEKNHIDLAALDWCLCALGEIEGTSYIKVDHRNKKQPYQFVRIQKTLPNFSERKIVLDGTGSKPEMDSLFGRDFQLIEGKVELSNCKKIFIQQAVGKVKAKKMDDAKLETLLKKATAYINPATDRRILIATHMAVEESVGEIARRLLPDCEIETVHFWNGRGINEYESFDSVICFGTPTVNPAGVLDTALILFDEEKDREEWILSCGDSDLVQTIHRIRPVNGDKKIIVIGRSWPDEIGRPDLRMDLRRGETSDGFEQAYDRIKSFVGIHRFLTKEIIWCLGVGEKRDADMVEAYSDLVFQDQKVDQKGVPYLIRNILLDKGYLFGETSKPELILLSKHGTWNMIIDRLKLDFPEIPRLEYSSKKTGGQLTTGFGSVKAVRDFYSLIDIPFASDSWHGEETETAVTPERKQVDNQKEIEAVIHSLFIENRDTTLSEYTTALEPLTSRRGIKWWIEIYAIFSMLYKSRRPKKAVNT